MIFVQICKKAGKIFERRVGEVVVKTSVNPSVSVPKRHEASRDIFRGRVAVERLIHSRIFICVREFHVVGPTDVAGVYIAASLRRVSRRKSPERLRTFRIQTLCSAPRTILRPTRSAAQE